MTHPTSARARGGGRGLGGGGGPQSPRERGPRLRVLARSPGGFCESRRVYVARARVGAHRGERGAHALIAFMNVQKSQRSATTVPRSLMGVGGSSGSTLSIPKDVPPLECRMLCAELEASVFSEGVSSAMGGGGGKTKGSTTLNRRGGHATDQWQPLIWACKDAQMSIAEQLLGNGHDINKTEPIQDKGSSAWGPLHWAASKGHLQVLQMLIARGANVHVKDKHGSTARAIAEKKGLKEVVATLEQAERAQPA